MKQIEISWKTIVFAVLFPLAIYFVWIVRDLIFSLFIAFIVMSALKPATVFFTKRRVPRTVAVVIVYFLFVLTIVSLFLIIVPPIINETLRLVSNMPEIIEEVERSIPNIGEVINLDRTAEYLPDATNQAVQFLGGFVSNTFFIIATFFFSFYFLLEEDLVKRLLLKYLDRNRALEAHRIIQLAEQRMSAWFWGELALMTVVGVVSYIGFSLIGLRFALPLAVLAGILEVVPNIGPVIAAIPAVIIGFSQSYLIALFAIALALIIQQLENAFIVPQIMKRAVGINPIITLLALLVGGRIGGILGVLLAIPIFLCVETIITEGLKQKGTFVKKKVEKGDDTKHA
jgi:predicted PurR-regulated permease PerM